MNTEECVSYYKSLRSEKGMTSDEAADQMMTDMGILPEDMIIIVEKGENE